MTQHENRRLPSWKITLSSHASLQRELSASDCWERRLNTLGLGEQLMGNLPGYHFERDESVDPREGAVLDAYFASGGGGIRAVIRNWLPDNMSFDLDIVGSSDGLTCRTYRWLIEPVSEKRRLESLQIQNHYSIRLFDLTKILLWPLAGRVLAKHAINERF
jgi:hypothetical protein